MKKKIEKDKIADFECSVMVKLNNEIAKKFDEYIVEGLKRKGFEFETKEELISFISNNCTCEIDNDLECRVYLVNGSPFFAYYPKLVPECDYSKINEPIFTFDLGYFSYID